MIYAKPLPDRPQRGCGNSRFLNRVGRLLFAVCGGFCLSTATTPALAGGGPESVLLVVNANSESSKTIANHYIEWRKIPATHVLYLDWKGSLGLVSGDEFRDGILMPIFKALDDRHLTSQIDYIVYSSDFPWKIDLQPIFPHQKFPPPFDAAASLTGATFLSPFIMSNNPALVMPMINWYVPGPIGPNQAECTQLTSVPSRGFRSRYLWDPEGKKTDDKTKGQRYLLCTTLGITRGRGNTVDEVLSYLRRSVASDGTRPKGTIYFMWNKDVRSSVRDKCFAAMAADINALGVRAKVQQGRVPDGAKDVTGMMVGTSDFDLAKSGIVIRPGAICEHLTSAGGIMAAGTFQTPLSEFLRHGAAGASGTVVEPRAIQAKFPLPSLQLHYARGCSLAEAFYQSTAGPYQLLIVGDPLCQPWAAFPNVTVAGIKPDEQVKGSLSFTPSGTARSPHSIGVFELFVDGRVAARIPPGATLTLDTTKLADGYHELRIVGVDSSPIETQGRCFVPIVVKNHDAAIELKVPTSRVKYLDKLQVSVQQPGASAIKIRQNSRDVASVQGEAGQVEIPAATLGRGPTTLQAFSEGSVAAASAPVRILVE